MNTLEEYGIEDNVPDVPTPDEAAAAARREQLRAMLAKCAFDPAKQPKPLRAIYSLGGVVIATPGNLLSLCAQVKAGKSAAIEAAIASVLTDNDNADTLSFKSSNSDGKAVIHIDTEQSEDDFQNLIDRALRRAGLTRAQKPEWLLSYNLSGRTAIECRELFDEALAIGKERFGAVHSALIDGGADLVNDVNDPKECNPFVAKLHGQAKEFDCPILSVLHFNPVSSKGGIEKSRGHLGSQLERKCETNLRLDKDADGVTVIWSEKQRRAPILRAHGPCFKWSDEASMHVSCESATSARTTKQIEKYNLEVEEVWPDARGLRYTEALAAIKKTLRVRDTTAGDRFTEYNKFGLINKSVANLWVKAI